MCLTPKRPRSSFGMSARAWGSSANPLKQPSLTIWGFPKIRGTLFGDPHIKDYSILGSILGSPYLGKLPYTQENASSLASVISFNARRTWLVFDLQGC